VSYIASNELVKPVIIGHSLGGAYFTHREHRNRRIVNTETADGERVSDVTVIGWTYFSVGSSGLRRDGPFSMSLWAVWMRRSQIASAWVDSLM